MKGFFRKLFNIHAGEEKSALLFALLGFLWSFGVTSGWKFADAFFLLHVGAEALPMVYRLTAISLILLAAFLMYIFHFVSIQRIFAMILFSGIVFYSIAAFCLSKHIGVDSNWIWYALRIYGTLFFAIVMTCFWTFVDRFFLFKDAKRLYSLFSSTIFVGIGATGITMRSGWLNEYQMIAMVITILAASIGLITFICKNVKAIEQEPPTSESEARLQSATWKQQVRAILSSPFTILLMTGNFLTYVLLVLVEYNYMSSFEAAFQFSGETDLQQFLGKWISVVSITNLVIGLFIYSRLIQRFGIGSLVVCTPILLLATFSGWSISESLLFPIMGLFVAEGTLYVIDDSNFNLLLNTLPIHLKYKIRLVIESFFEPIGMLVSSMLLSVTWLDSKTMGLILSGCLLSVALLLKAHTFKGFYLNLREWPSKISHAFFQWTGAKKATAAE